MTEKYICLDCGCTFDEPKLMYESRGEFWGAPCTETIPCCPHCNGGFMTVEEWEEEMFIETAEPVFDGPFKTGLRGER